MHPCGKLVRDLLEERLRFVDSGVYGLGGALHIFLDLSDGILEAILKVLPEAEVHKSSRAIIEHDKAIQLAVSLSLVIASIE